jgi:hypothetical protein
MLTPEDLERLGFEFGSEAGTDASAFSRGIASSVPVLLRPASISFRYDNDERSTFELAVAVVNDERARGIPSILGRDVLFRGQLSVGRLGLTWDIEPGEHDLTA